MGRIRKRGFTLIELLCVTAIIGILASMLLGAVSRAYARARRFDWEMKSGALIDQFRDRMRTDFGNAPKYPALTIDQLYEGRLIDSSLRDFLKDKRVQFSPFSSESVMTQPILAVNIAKDRMYIMFKQEIYPKNN